MELNADLVAVSVTGSDALIHWLCRAAFADRCMKLTVAELRTALDHQLYTSDLFCHLSHAARQLRGRDADPALGEPPALPADRSQTTQVFDADQDTPASAWSLHPTNRERERNAKARYIRSEFDERPAWILFDNPRQLRAAVTRMFYRACGNFSVPRLVERGGEEKRAAILLRWQETLPS